MWIKDIVKDLVKKHGTNNPYEIASAKKIYVFEHDMHEEILGFYKYIRKNKFIYINANLPKDEKLFTCAHELGHSEIHPKLNTPFLKRKTLFSVDRIENEANRFAVELLMPDDSLIDYKDTRLSISEIGELHGIPREVCHLKKF